jgi:hypothetical protein
MKSEYTIRFFPEGATEPITRTFKPRYTMPTNRARAAVLSSGVDKYVTDPDSLDSIMNILLIGNTEGVAWADAVSAETDAVVSDFFTMLGNRNE